MATKSFTSDTFVLNNNNASKFCSKKKVRIAKVEGHKNVTSREEIMRLLNIK